MKWIKDRFPIVMIWVLLFATYGGLVWQYQMGQNYAPPVNTNPTAQSLVPPIHQIVKRAAAQNNRRAYSNQEYQELQVAAHKSQKWMAGSAVIGILLGIIGSILLFGTLIYTRNAATSASDTLGIARDTLNQATEHSRRELRPYLRVEVDIRNIYNSINADSRGNYAPVGFSVRLKNGGSTPAHNVELQCHITRGSEEFLFDPRWTDYGDGVLVSPNQEVLREYCTSGGLLERRLRERLTEPNYISAINDYIMVKVDVGYSDIFDFKHTQVSMFSIPYSDIERFSKIVTDSSGRRVQNVHFVEKSGMLLMASDETSEIIEENQS